MKAHLISLMVLLIGACCLVLATKAAVQAGPIIWAPPDLAVLIEEALAENKELQSLEAKVESLKEEISFAGSLDDPRLGIGVINLPTDSFSFDQEAMTQKMIFIAQKVPWFGKLSLKEQSQALIAGSEQAVLEARRLELAREIATTYYELSFITTSSEINRRLTEMVSQIIKVAETRYASGSGLQQDVLRAQVELSKLLDEKIILRKKRRVLEDRINELLNRESFIQVAPPKNLRDPKLTLDVEALKARSLRKNPWLRVRQFKVDRAAVEINLARKDYWPDMDFIVAYGQRDEDFTGRDLPDLFSASVVVNIPLWQKNRQDKNLEAKRKNYQAATKSYENLAKSLPYRIDALATDIRDTQENYRLFSDALMIQAEQLARSALSAYVVNKVEFNTMINAQMRLLRFELKSKQYLFNIYQKRAELEEVLGGPLISE